MQGNAQAAAGRFADAAASYGRAIQLHPRYTVAHVQLGQVQQALGHFVDAELSYRRALGVQHDLAAAHLGLGNVLRVLGRMDEALDAYRHALATDPDMTMAWNNLGATFNDLGMPGRALACCRQALQLEPSLALAHYNLANAQRDLHQPDEAVTGYRQALALQPRFADAWLNLGSVLATQGQHDQALQCQREALALAPADPRVHVHLANVLKDLGRFDEAMAAYRQALKLRPDDAEARSNLLFCLSHGSGVDLAQWAAEHRAFGARYDGLALQHEGDAAVVKDADRRLNVGFVSADLRSHAVAGFLEPLLERLCQSPRLTLHAYSNHWAEDDTTQRLKPCFAHWNRVVGLCDARLAERIHSDGIDILVDLSGHTGGNRLLTFARRPAPVQVSWLGYPGTTGLGAVDYYLADRLLVPDEASRAQFTEQIVYLPAIAPYLPPREAPAVNALPALHCGRITFGSFHRMTKLSSSVVALWSALMCRISGSRMLLVGLPETSQSLVAGWFEQQGVTRDRLEFQPRCGMARYLALHHGVDICLDAFPYNGATTTSHALWMGVPTLTLAGQSPQGRVGAAILKLLGLEDFIASTHADFVDRGLRAVSDLEFLAQLRAGLRSRFRDCPAVHPALISAALDQAFRLMWRRWCEGLPPTTLDVGVAATVAP